ncbi:branched-chain amino acid ABC transporter permease (plasmid) [Rhodococcus globerulus]|uniref:branched-chain amino acid ABC transporter permease n=1 Tax=Rhodococcus globerulus TaxID=33008 RepID=UPI0039EB97C2
MDIWITRIFNGVTYGGFLFILASGFTLSLGVLRISNIAHGAFYLVGAYTAWSVFESTNSLLLSVVAAAIVVGLLGITMHRVTLRSLHMQPLRQILSTMGVALIIAEVTRMIWGGRPRVMTQPEWLRGAVDIFSISFPKYRLFMFAVAVAIGLFLWFLIRRTRVGALTRASVDNAEMVRSLGVNVSRLQVGVFGVSAVLAGIAGGIGAPFIGAYQGAEFATLLLSLVVVVLGGLGSLGGAFVAALLIGLFDSVGRALFPDLSYFTLYVPMIVALIIRPQGIGGKS